jgi:hypothetical protein
MRQSECASNEQIICGFARLFSRNRPQSAAIRPRRTSRKVDLTISATIIGPAKSEDNSKPPAASNPTAASKPTRQKLEVDALPKKQKKTNQQKQTKNRSSPQPKPTTAAR